MNTLFETLLTEERLCDIAQPVLANISQRLAHFNDFTPLQKKAFFSTPEFWNREKHLMVCGATSSGKTMVAEIAMLECMARSEKSVIYLSPLRAMVSEKHRQFSKDFENTALGHQGVFASDKDHQNDDFYITEGDYSIAVIVYEKFYALLAQGKADEMLKNCGMIVFDEIQMIAHEDRGVKILMSLINALNINPSIRTMFMTTSYSDMTRTIALLNANIEKEIVQITDSQSSMALEEMIICCNGKYKGKYTPSIRDMELNEDALASKLARKRTELYTDVREESALPVRNIVEFDPDAKGGREKKINLLLNVINFHKDKKIIAFIHSRDTCRRLSERIARSGILEKTELSDELVRRLQAVDNREQRDQFINDLFPYGVAYHHGGLSQAVRDIIEDEFSGKDGSLNVLLATETLAIGVNLPADVIIVYDTETRGGNTDRPVAIDTQTYKNYIGRAGRLGLSDDSFVPKSYLLAIRHSEMDEYWNKYVNAKSTEIIPAYESLKIDTGMPYFLSMLSNGSYTVDQLNEAIRRKMPSLGEQNFFKTLLGKDAENNRSLSTYDPNFLNAWNAASLLQEELDDSFDYSDECPRYILSHCGVKVVPYALSVRTCAQIWRSFVKQGTQNLLLRYDYVNDRSEDCDLSSLLFFVCRMKEIDNLHRIFVPSFQDDDRNYNRFRDILQAFLREKIKENPTAKFEDMEKLILCDDPSSLHLTAALRAFILDLWTKGVPLEGIRERIKLHLSIEEGDIERLADTVSFVMEAIASTLTASDSAELRGYASAFRRLANRVKYGGDDDIVRALNCHTYGLSRNTLIKLKNILSENGVADGSIFTYLSDEKSLMRYAIDAGITADQYEAIRSMLKNRYSCKKTQKLVFNLRSEGLLPDELEACLNDNNLSIHRAADFIENAAGHEKMTYVCKKLKTEESRAPYYHLADGHYNLFCIILKDMSVYAALSDYAKLFCKMPGKYVVIAEDDLAVKLQKELEEFSLCTFTFYSPENLLRLYLECSLLCKNHSPNVFLHNLQTQNGLITEISASCPTEYIQETDHYDVFISYSHHQNHGLVSDLFDLLNSRGKATFLDSVSIRAGHNFVQKILKGIRNTDTYVLLLNKEYRNGSWTEEEFAQIKYECVENKKKFIPVCLDDEGFALLKESGLGTSNAIMASKMSREILIKEIIDSICD